MVPFALRKNVKFSALRIQPFSIPCTYLFYAAGAKS